jgi:quinol monooxygenase YgiN
VEAQMAATAVTMTVRWVVPIGESRSIGDALHQVMLAAQTHPGCLRCAVSTEVSRLVDLKYTEEWADEDMLRREVRSERFATLATLMEYATSQPKVEFVLPDGVRGLEYATEVRAGTER